MWGFDQEGQSGYKRGLASFILVVFLGELSGVGVGREWWSGLGSVMG